MIANLRARRGHAARPPEGRPASGQASFESLESRLCLSAAAAHVYPQGATVNGHTLGEWAQAWSKWAYETPAATNPLHDETGQFAAANQPKGVFFLAGSDSPGEHERTVTVSKDTKLFIPVLTTIWITLPSDEPITIDQIRAFNKESQDSDRAVFATIDGKAVKNVTSHREQDPGANGFTVNLPADNVFGVDAGSYPKSAIDGIFLMTQPLSPGRHTIHFGGVIAAAGNFALDMTYHVNVLPPGHDPSHHDGHHGHDDPGPPSKFCDKPVKARADKDDYPWD